MKIIKQISKQGVEKLLEAGVIKNTKRGYVNEKGTEIGFYRTKGAGRKRYIENEYVKILEELD